MGDPFCDPGDHQEARHEASEAAITRAQVFVEVSGGIAEVTVTSGPDSWPVDIIQIDWDNVEDADTEWLANTLEDARLILDEEIRNNVVFRLEERLDQRRADEKWSEQQAKRRRSEERERAASLLGIVEGSPAWDYYTSEEDL